MAPRSSLFLALALGAAVPAHGRIDASSPPLDGGAVAMKCDCEKGGKGCTCPKGQCECPNCHARHR